MEEKVILCYGDSNTWGHNPDGSGRRHPRDVRWPGVLAKELGTDYYIIEDGIGGRTTVFDDPWSNDCRNGYKGLGYALSRAKPLDMVILMLGTNDLKFTDGYGAARGAEKLVKTLKAANGIFLSSSPVFPREPKILLIAPIQVGEAVDRRPVRCSIHGQHQTSLLFATEYARIAREQGVAFLDAALYASPSELDGVHMEADSHLRLGKAVAEKVRELFA